MSPAPRAFAQEIGNLTTKGAKRHSKGTSEFFFVPVCVPLCAFCVLFPTSHVGCSQWHSRPVPSRTEGIGPFHCEAVRTDLRGIRRCDTGELCPDVVDDVEVAVRSVVISQTQIGTDCLRV